MSEDRANELDNHYGMLAFWEILLLLGGIALGSILLGVMILWHLLT